MATPAIRKRPDVVDGPQYACDIKQFLGAEEAIRKVVDDEIIPAVLADPISPHRCGAGTPICSGVLSKRVPNTAGGSGRRGGFRLDYLWDRQNNRIVKLRLQLRKDGHSLPRKAVEKLLSETPEPKP